MLTLALVLAQYDDPYKPSDAALAGFFLIFSLVALAVAVIVVAAQWTLFKKAGQPGWAAIIPIYNLVVILKIVHRPLWWLVLFFIPGVNLVFLFIVNIDLARAFGRDTVFGVGMALLSFVFYPLLAWSDSTYDPTRLPAAAAT